MEEGENSGFEEEHDFLPCSWAKKVELSTFEGLAIKNHSLCCGEETKYGERKLVWEAEIEVMREKEVDISMKREKLKHIENVVDFLKKQDEDSTIKLGSGAKTEGSQRQSW